MDGQSPGKRKRRSIGWLVMAALWAPCAQSVDADSSREAPGERSVRFNWQIGPVHRRGMKVSSRGSSRARQEPAPALIPRRSGVIDPVTPPPPVGPNPDRIELVGDRDFDNGFVHRDFVSDLDGSTVNWGYQDAEQYDAQAGTLTFQRRMALAGSSVSAGFQSERSVRTDIDAAGDSDARIHGSGLAVELGMRMRPRAAVQAEWILGLRVFPDIQRSLYGSTLHQTVTERRAVVTETITVEDVVTDIYVYESEDPRNFPDPVYDGSAADPYTDFFINNRPSTTERRVVRSGHVDRTAQVCDSTWQASNRIDLDVSTDLFQLVIGPRLRCRIGSHFSAQLTPALLLNYVAASIDRHETLTRTDADGRTTLLGAWHDRVRQSEWRSGLQVQAGADWSLAGGWFAGLRAGYEWIEPLRVAAGPNAISLDLSATTLTALIGAVF